MFVSLAYPKPALVLDPVLVDVAHCLIGVLLRRCVADGSTDQPPL